MTIKRGGVAEPISPNLPERERWRPHKYCTKCPRHIDTALRPRLYKEDELIEGRLPSDSNLWLQCYQCGTTYLDDRVMQPNMLTSDIQPLRPLSHLAQEGSEKAPPIKHERGFNERLEDKTGDQYLKDLDVKRELKAGAKLLFYTES